MAPHLTVKKGSGSWITAHDNTTRKDRRLLDMTCGIGATSTGHCHPKVVEAVQAQVGNMVHAQQNIFGSHTSQEELVAEMKSIVPANLDSFFWSNSGSEAVDNAIKIARTATKRTNIVSFTGGFHGRTMGAMSITSSKHSYKTGFHPMMPGCFFSPWPYSSANPMTPMNAEDPAAEFDALVALENLLEQQTAPEDTAAIFIEPIQGEGGIQTPPPHFMKGLRHLCDEHGILLVIDEVQSGAGRSGMWWAHQEYGVEADMLIFAKGIASGYQLAGIAGPSAIMASPPINGLGGTYGGNAVSCAAAVATIRTIKEEGILENVQARSLQFTEGIAELSKTLPIKDVRGRGLMLGIELSLPKGASAKVAQACLKRDVLILTAGTKETMRLLPPLNCTQSEVAHALEVFGEALLEVADGYAADVGTAFPPRIDTRVQKHLKN